VIITYAVAAVVAMAAGLKAAQHPRLEFWRRWDRGLVRFVMAWFYLLHGIAGIAVTALANHLDWVPLPTGSGREWANGALYGIAAAVFLRIEITSFGLVHVDPARTVFRIGLEFFEGRLDAGVARAVPRQLGDLQPVPLWRVAWRLYNRHVESELHPADADAHGDWLNDLTDQTLAGAAYPTLADTLEANERLQATERVRQYCEDLILDNCDATIHLGDVPPPDPQS